MRSFGVVELEDAMELSDTAEQDVRDLELGRFRAMIEGDTITLARIFADELAYGHSDGGHDTKASLIDKIASGHLNYLDIENPDLKVAVVGETAVVTGRMVARLRVGGATRHLNNRSLSVWARSDRRWVFLAFQPTVLQQA